jgi:hypothetical protein
MKKAPVFTPNANGFTIAIGDDQYTCRRKTEGHNTFWAIFNKSGEEIAVALGAAQFDHTNPSNGTRQSILNSIG